MITYYFKKLLPTLALILFNNTLSAQDLYDKLTRKLCRCIEKEKITSVADMGSCFEELVANNLKEIKEHYNASTLSEIDMEEIGGKIGAKMIKECDYVIKNFPNGIVGGEKKVSKQVDLSCDDIKNGDFYYLTQRPNSDIRDTTFVTISNKMFLERMKNGRTYSLLEITWKDDCKFDLEFQESNDPLKKQISEPGEIYQYEILVNEKNSIFLKTYWQKREFQFELVKIK